MPRIVSLVPSLTAGLIDLGREECVVGRTRFCPDGQDPDPVRVGGTKDPDLSRILDLRPDFVLVVKEENRLETVAGLRAAGVKVLVYDPRRVEEAPALAWSLGRLTDARTEASFMAGELAEEIARARARAARRQRLPVAYLIWRKPWMVVGAETFIGDVLRTVGLDSVFPGRYPQVEPAEIVTAGPELVLFSSEPFPFEHRHLDEFRRTARLADADPPLLRPCRGDLVGWYPSRTGAALRHLEDLL